MTKNEKGLCRTRRCQAEVHAKGLCRAHYRKARLNAAPACSTRGCTEPAHARTMCRTHYARVLRAEMREMSLNVSRAS